MCDPTGVGAGTGVGALLAGFLQANMERMPSQVSAQSNQTSVDKLKYKYVSFSAGANVPIQFCDIHVLLSTHSHVPGAGALAPRSSAATLSVMLRACRRSATSRCTNASSVAECTDAMCAPLLAQSCSPKDQAVVQAALAM
jgi:hypothetical protein